MDFTLENARVRAGLSPSDTSRDAEFTAAMDFVLAVVENYCDRRFAFKVETEKFYYTSHRPYQLTRYPVSRLRSLTAEGWNGQIDPRYYKMNYGRGTIEFSAQLAVTELQAVYDGGYTVWPADLLYVLWNVYDAVLPTIGGGQTGAVLPVGSIESITVMDVGTVRFANGGGGGSAGNNNAPGKNFDMSSLSPYFFLLDKYKREWC